jgi:hypothetical protein
VRPQPDQPASDDVGSTVPGLLSAVISEPPSDVARPEIANPAQRLSRKA